MPVCPGCGDSFDDRFNFCPSCGRAKPEPPKLNLEVNITRKSSPEDCPKCGHDDKTQKASAIVAAGTSQSDGTATTSGSADIYSAQTGEKVGEGRTSSTTYAYNQQQSSLAKKLTPPAAPKEPQPGQFNTNLPDTFFGKIIIGVGWLLGMYLGGAILHWGQSFWSIIGILFCAGPIVGMGGVFLLSFLIDTISGSNEKYQEAKKEYDQALLVYQKAKAQWDQLYYCHKHDLVFVAGSDKTAPVSETWQACEKWSE